MEPAMIAIIDDEQQVANEIKGYLNQMYKAQKIIIPISIVTFTSIPKFQKALKTDKYDLLIMDIWLNAEINGLDLAQQARVINHDTQVIFISGYVDFLPNVWDNGALRFIHKPVTYIKLQEAITHWLRIIMQRYIEFKFISEGREVIIYASDILYIESKNKELILRNRDETQYVFKGKIKAIEEQLAPFNFIRCHHSFFINMQYLVEIKNKNRCGEAILSLQDNKSISVPISSRKRYEVMAAYNRYSKTGIINV